MGEMWTDEMQADLERWQAIEEESANPKDFLIPDPAYRDVVRGLARYIVAAIRYPLRRGVEPFRTIRQQIDIANVNRQIGPARLKECEEWLKADPMVGGFEGLIFDDD